jgi:hypothetical protein
VPELVVDHLEAVEVEHEQRARLPAAGTLDDANQVVFEDAAVRQVGQRVVRRQVLHLCRLLLLLGDVRAEHDDAGDFFAGVERGGADGDVDRRAVLADAADLDVRQPLPPQHALPLEAAFFLLVRRDGRVVLPVRLDFRPAEDFLGRAVPGLHVPVGRQREDRDRRAVDEAAQVFVRVPELSLGVERALRVVDAADGPVNDEVEGRAAGDDEDRVLDQPRLDRVLGRLRAEAERGPDDPDGGDRRVEPRDQQRQPPQRIQSARRGGGRE